MQKLTKKQAEKLYYSGNELILVPSKCGIGSMFQVTIERKLGYCHEENFDKIINAFHYYNCNRETGLSIHFYKPN